MEMGRDKIIKIIEDATKSCGREFYTGFEYRLNSEVQKLPALWLLPITLNKKEGRREGRKQYAVKFILIDLIKNGEQSEKESVWAEMERELEQVVERIYEAESVIDIELDKYDVSELSLTNRGEIALKAGCTLWVSFCRQNI